MPHRLGRSFGIYYGTMYMSPRFVFLSFSKAVSQGLLLLSHDIAGTCALSYVRKHFHTSTAFSLPFTSPCTFSPRSLLTLSPCTSNPSTGFRELPVTWGPLDPRDLFKILVCTAKDPATQPTIWVEAQTLPGHKEISQPQKSLRSHIKLVLLFIWWGCA
jgi:hypothetical protein